jgi:hypothetical protein
MRKYLSLIFKGLGILSLIIAVGIIVSAFFILPKELRSYPEKVDRCESHHCISIGPKGSEKFEDCVSNCTEKLGIIYSGGFLAYTLILLPGGIIFFVVLGIILLVISAFLRAKKEDEI